MRARERPLGNRVMARLHLESLGGTELVRIRSTPGRSEVAKNVGGEEPIPRGGRPCAPEILRARDVALSFGNFAHGPHAQLYDWRRCCALQTHVRIECASSHGLGFLWFAR